MVMAGVKLSEVYEAASSLVKKERPQLIDKLTKSVGQVSTAFILLSY